MAQGGLFYTFCMDLEHFHSLWWVLCVYYCLAMVIVSQGDRERERERNPGLGCMQSLRSIFNITITF